MILQTVNRIGDNHITLIRRNGHGHIKQESVDYYAAQVGEESPDILVEARDDWKLVAVSFAACLDGLETSYSITIVRASYRGMGIGEALLAFKRMECLRRGWTLVATVHPANEIAIKMNQRIHGGWAAFDPEKGVTFVGVAHA